MSYYINEHGIECFEDEEYGNVYIKNKKGRLFIVNRTTGYAKKNSLKVVYRNDDGQVIIVPGETQKRRINKKIRKAREEVEFYELMRWNGILRAMKDGNV